MQQTDALSEARPAARLCVQAGKCADAIVNLRLPLAEKVALQARARDAGLSLSEYIRRACVDTPAPKPKTRKPSTRRPANPYATIIKILDRKPGHSFGRHPLDEPWAHQPPDRNPKRAAQFAYRSDASTTPKSLTGERLAVYTRSILEATA